MRLLVDTCTFLWLAADDPQLSTPAKSACVDPSHDVFVSAISAWEIAIKYRLGRLGLPEPPHTYVPDRRQKMRLDALDFDELAAAHTHLLPAHHRDPFDRIIIAQAKVRDIPIVTNDSAFDGYGIGIMW